MSCSIECVIVRSQRRSFLAAGLRAGLSDAADYRHRRLHSTRRHRHHLAHRRRTARQPAWPAIRHREYSRRRFSYGTVTAAKAAPDGFFLCSRDKLDTLFDVATPAAPAWHWRSTDPRAEVIRSATITALGCFSRRLSA